MDRIKARRTPSGIAIVTIDRPERRNACNQAMWRELGRVFRDLGEDAGVRGVVLTGAGGHFCAGADISEFETARQDAAGAERYEQDVGDCERAIRDCPKPTVAAVAGYAMGGGCGLTVVCDFRIADGSARFGIPAARLGIVYTALECAALANVVGVVNAKKILFGGDWIDAATAESYGLVDAVTDGDVVEAALAFLARMAENAPLSIQGAKMTLNAIAHGEVAAREPQLRAFAARAADSADYAEGRRAFMEKRPPRFTGR